MSPEGGKKGVEGGGIRERTIFWPPGPLPRMNFSRRSFSFRGWRGGYW